MSLLAALSGHIPTAPALFDRTGVISPVRPHRQDGGAAAVNGVGTDMAAMSEQQNDIALELRTLARLMENKAPVTGHSAGIPCLLVRSEAGVCGPDGRLWEAQNE